MSEWMISAHSVAVVENRQPNGIWTPKRVPCSALGNKTINVYYYAPIDKQLGMNAGWILWDMLLYAELGGVEAARAAAFSQITINSQTEINNYHICSFEEDADSWVDSKQGHYPGSALGIWEVGSPAKPPVVDLSPPKAIRALDLITMAANQNIEAIYWTACRAFKFWNGQLTKSSQEIYWPKGLPAGRDG